MSAQRVLPLAHVLGCPYPFRHPLASFQELRRTLAVFADVAKWLLRQRKWSEDAHGVPMGSLTSVTAPLASARLADRRAEVQGEGLSRARAESNAEAVSMRFIACRALGTCCQIAFRHRVALFRRFRQTLAAFAAFAMWLMRRGNLRECVRTVPKAVTSAGSGSTVCRRTPSFSQGAATPSRRSSELCARTECTDTEDVAALKRLAVSATPRRPPAARSSDTAVVRTSMTVALAVSLVSEARELGVNVSQAAEAGIAAAVSLRRQERWLAENKAALESSNDYVQQRGLPLAQYRSF